MDKLEKFTHKIALGLGVSQSLVFWAIIFVLVLMIFYWKYIMKFFVYGTVLTITLPAVFLAFASIYKENVLLGIFLTALAIWLANRMFSNNSNTAQHFEADDQYWDEIAKRRDQARRDNEHRIREQERIRKNQTPMF